MKQASSKMAGVVISSPPTDAETARSTMEEMKRALEKEKAGLVSCARPPSAYHHIVS